jgi:hypothetical protein
MYLVAVSVTPVRQFVYASVSALSPTLWHRAVSIYRYVFFVVRDHSPSPAPVHFICTIASVTPTQVPGSFNPSLDSRPGTTALPSLFSVSSIIYIVARYHYMYRYRYNIRPCVVIPLQGLRHRHPSSLSLYVYCNFSHSHSPPT